jgi:dihydropyrimidinase
MDLLIKNGKIVTAEKTFIANITIDKGIIKAIGRNLHADAKAIIDAKGMLVFPGIIDAHVHFQLPAGGTVTSEDFARGTRAAACGGVTTVIDFAIQKKGKTLSQAIRARRKEADGKVAIDYALHAVPTDWNPKTKKEIGKITANGITSFKMYMVYAKAGLMSDDAALFSALEESSKCGGMVTVHAESAGVLDILIGRYHNKKNMKRFGAYCHVLSRPNFIEAEAIQRAVTWAEATGGRLYIVHLSTAEGVEIIRQAKRRGVDVYAETCPHYLLFDDSVFMKPNGYLYATCPQIKKKADAKALWKGLSDGTISVVATDNCTFSSKQKAPWHGDFTKIPYGLPGVETLLPLLYTYGVGKGLISLSKMIELLCVNPARLFGLYPQKGTISPGFDADLVIFNPRQNVTVSHERLQTECDWSPYEGFKLKGYPALTISRGEIVAENGRFVGSAGHGKYLKRGKSNKPV